MIEGMKLINLYAALADQEEEADEIRATIREQLVEYSKNIEVDPKAIKSGYNLYKKYKKGKDTQNTLDDLTEVENIITAYFVSSDLGDDK